MVLEDRNQPAKTTKIGRQTIEIPAGKRLKIETSPEGEEILNVVVPAGKKWSTYIYLEITETAV